MKLAFMLSNWYSGATLLAILLNKHREITCNGETFPFRQQDMYNYICSCGKEVNKCDYYTKVASHMLINNDTWDRENFLILPHFSNKKIINNWLQSFTRLYPLRDLTIELVPKYRKVMKRFIKAHIEFYYQACIFSNSMIYIDGTKSVRRAELFAKYTEFPLKTIHLIRDGRGFCYSFIKNRNLSKDELPAASKAWLEYLEMIDHFSFRYRKLSQITIRYEDLCSDLKCSLREICDFLEISFDSSLLNGDFEGYHILGNVMRKGFNGMIKEDLSWKTELTPGEIQKITMLMESGMKRFGYI